ncbi:MAG: GH3 auxin-responsive promoter family protein [Candidatus Saganbacteria bacterium]|nr:GH3 auxin-responsive promoter family protein [Candidatus Saganbacteria bacterium]
MLKKLARFFIYYLLRLTFCKDALAFKRSLKDIKRTQKEILLRIISSNRNTLFGKKHRFKNIKTIDDFKKEVPLTDYEYYSAYVERIKKGEPNILTKEEVLILEPTSGSQSASKLIPYTRGLQREFQKSIFPWLFNILKTNPLLSGSMYWSISPALNDYKNVKSKIKIGFENDEQYFGNAAGLLIKNLLTVPPLVSKIKNFDSFCYITLLFLIKDKSLSIISVWSPTFLLLLLEPLKKWQAVLINDVESGKITPPEKIEPYLLNKIKKLLRPDPKRAAELKKIIIQNNPSKIWPNLSLISCWTESNAGYYVKELQKLFPETKIQGKGLMATECFVSHPINDRSENILSINSHFFEFKELNNKKQLLLADQLKAGKRYSVVATTSGGLYRYQLCDIVEVVGFKNNCPLLRFIGKEDNICDLVGEKLNEAFLASFLPELFKKHLLTPSFFMVVPEKTHLSFYYLLLLEFKTDPNHVKLEKLRQDVEAMLLKNVHYQYARKIGQLKKLQLFLINNSAPKAIDTYIERCYNFGQRGGDIKPKILDRRMGWIGVFNGRILKEE